MTASPSSDSFTRIRLPRTRCSTNQQLHRNNPLALHLPKTVGQLFSYHILLAFRSNTGEKSSLCKARLRLRNASLLVNKENPAFLANVSTMISN